MTLVLEMPAEARACEVIFLAYGEGSTSDLQIRDLLASKGLLTGATGDAHEFVHTLKQRGLLADRGVAGLSLTGRGIESAISFRTRTPEVRLLAKVSLDLERLMAHLKLT